MSGSEVNFKKELPIPRNISAPATVTGSSSLCPTPGSNVPTATASDYQNARKPGNRRATSISILKIENMSIRENQPIKSEESSIVEEIEQKSCPAYTLSSVFERFPGDTYLQTYYDDFEEGAIDFPSPGRFHSSSEKAKTSRCRKRTHSLGRRSFPSCSLSITRNWAVVLENECLWRTFSDVGTEMVITKTGRRMFPHLSISVHGLNPTKLYSLKMCAIPADSYRYKFIGDAWAAIGKAEGDHIHSDYTHPDSPNTGEHWMKKLVTFKLVKLTNNKSSKSEIILQSMHKYMTQIIVVDEDGDEAEEEIFSFPETTFIAVTAYQNEKITQLKIDHNPYARAFRESIPGETPEQEPRVGGHAKRIRSVAGAFSSIMTRTAAHSRSTSPQSTSTGFTSLESGFESDGERASKMSRSLLDRHTSCPVKRNYIPSCNSPIPGINDIAQNTIKSPVYWADEFHSLYNQELLAPLPKLDPSSSFSEPFLQACSRAQSLTSDYFLSPLKPLTFLQTTIEDDVFYH